jgi:hypothetical protein
MKDLKVQEMAFVDVPAVPKAKFILVKRKEADMELEQTDIDKRIAMQGYTGSSPGATTPAHIHEYYCYVNSDTGEMNGYAQSIADHSHRITPESYAKGETEDSDGHRHTLMLIKEARALMGAGRDHQEQLATIKEAVRDSVQEAVKGLAPVVVPATQPGAGDPSLGEGHSAGEPLTPEQNALLDQIGVRIKG